jgi:hypothetical protein
MLDLTIGIPVHKLTVRLPADATRSAKEPFPGWKARWLSMYPNRRPPGTLQRDLDGRYSLIGLTAREAAHIAGEQSSHS